MNKAMHKAKAITVKSPVKSAEQLASSLRFSKRRTHRIFAIVDRVSGKSPSAAATTVNGKRKRGVAVKSQNSRIGQRSNATTRKSVKAAR